MSFRLPKRAKNLTGERYSRLLVIRPIPKPETIKITSSFVWECLCDCGRIKLAETSKLYNGSIKSCGCLKKEADWNHRGMQRHGMHLSGEYISWKAMIRRCTKPSHKNYYNYGGRGITVCDRWRLFDNFLTDMGRKPSPKHTIDRHPNQNGNYEPTNCRWALRKDQSHNMRSNRMVTAFGRTGALASFFDDSKSAEYFRAIYRINTGWDAERAIKHAKGIQNG